MTKFLEVLERLQAFDDPAFEDDITETELADMDASLDEASLAIEEFAKDNCPDLPADFFSNE
jgi:hypothetical protein